jgi:hypothetical protein
VFYVGDSEIGNVNNWYDLVDAGKEHPEQNGKGGFRSYKGEAIHSIVPKYSGNYVLRIEYTVEVDGKTTTQVVSKQVLVKMGPTVSVDHGKLTIDIEAGYTIDLVTLFYIGEQELDDPTWNNCVKAAANVEGSPYGTTGYKMFYHATSANKATLTIEGNYVLRISYKTADGNAYMTVVEITV